MVGIKDFDLPSCCNTCEHWSFSHDDEPLCDLTYEYISQFDKRQDDCPLVEAIPKDQYEARLNADLEAILVDLQLEIEEQKFDNHIDKDTWNDAISTCSEVIQQKINALKGNE